MTVLAGADLVLPDRVVSGGSLVLDGGRIVAIEPRSIDAPAGASRLDLSGSIVVPGFIDVHVHGVEGFDTLDGASAVAEIATRLPRYGVTSFCPTSVACDPAALAAMLDAVARQPSGHGPFAARVLPAHLESNFINPDYKGAQPAACLRVPGRHGASRRPVLSEPSASPSAAQADSEPAEGSQEFTAADILDVIAAHRPAVGIVTLAPELDGGLDLARGLVARGHIVSIGHTGATFDEAREAIRAGVRHATHLFNRMSPMSHRAPGVPGAVLQAPEVTAELICDGFHVHPALMQVAIRVKGVSGVMAITDGTAGSGLPVGSRTRLGGRSILVTDRTATLEDGTLAGSVLTMNGAFRVLVQQVGLSLVEAAWLCATTPAAQLGLSETGRLQVGAIADLAVLDREFRVQHTYLAGQPWRNPPSAPVV